jgi:starvation-inducible outer membrane lipoprotein
MTKAVILKINTGLACLTACALLLSACVNPQKLQQGRADVAKFQAQRQEQDSNAQCSQTAMPGTPQHLACRLAKTSGAQ